MKIPRNRRTAIIGGGVAVIAGAATVIGVSLRQAPEKGAVEKPASAYAVCLMSELPLIKGADKRCYKPEALAALEDAPVIGGDGEAASVALSSPTDASAPTKDASTCREYNQLTNEGWYAMTAADMRREDYFKRACGTLVLLGEARAPEATYFENGELSEGDVRSLAQTAKFRIGPEEAPEAAPVVAKDEGSAWRITTGEQVAIIQPIAHADFNADGRGDMLVFVAMRIEGGTATASEIGLVEKAGEDGPVTFEAKD
ncbi:MAG TPA: hypothetical protein VNH64_02680 [Parvularculaceae bacterium]|nr:hypothetical protein [Parvularculaceae bacterium]